MILCGHTVILDCLNVNFGQNENKRCLRARVYHSSEKLTRFCKMIGYLTRSYGFLNQMKTKGAFPQVYEILRVIGPLENVVIELLKVSFTFNYCTGIHGLHFSVHAKDIR